MCHGNKWSRSPACVLSLTAATALTDCQHFCCCLQVFAEALRVRGTKHILVCDIYMHALTRMWVLFEIQRSVELGHTLHLRPLRVCCTLRSVAVACGQCDIGLSYHPLIPPSSFSHPLSCFPHIPPFEITIMFSHTTLTFSHAARMLSTTRRCSFQPPSCFLHIV